MIQTNSVIPRPIAALWGKPSLANASTTAGGLIICIVASKSKNSTISVLMTRPVQTIAPRTARAVSFKLFHHSSDLEVRLFEHLAHLDHVAILSRAAQCPCNRLFLRLDLDHPVAPKQLLRLGERPIGRSALAAGELDPRALLAGVQPVEREHHPRFGQLIVVLAHRGNQPGVRSKVRLSLFVPLWDHQHHESHRTFSSLPIRRTTLHEIDIATTDPDQGSHGPRLT